MLGSICLLKQGEAIGRGAAAGCVCSMSHVETDVVVEDGSSTPDDGGWWCV